MILNEEDVYNGFESYRNKNGLSQEQMAVLVGLKTKQAYGNMIKNKTMKLKYLINLINNTGVSSDYILNPETRKKQQGKDLNNPPENINIASDEKVTFYTCPDCIEKQKEINALKRENQLLEDKISLQNELLDKYREPTKKETEATDSAQEWKAAK